MIENFEDLLQKKKDLEESTKTLDAYAVKLINSKCELLNEIDKITEEMIRPLREEISQIDAEVHKIMTITGQEKLVGDRYGAYMKDETIIKITDKGKAWAWIQNNPQVLKKDILKSSEVMSLIKEGIVPDPHIDGVDCNDSLKKITYRRK